ncbi:MAG: hypothetical protein MRY63_13900 [Neomegalonema sp.]|nr:hypothetical protein [Neomegalonema sp.]
MAEKWVFRALLVLSCLSDLIAWTWRDLAFTRALEPELARGDAALMITAALFAIGAIPLWRLWRYSGVFMLVLTVAAVLARLPEASTAHTTSDGITALEIIAATAWGAMLAMALLPGTRAMFNRGLFGGPAGRASSD